MSESQIIIILPEWFIFLAGICLFVFTISSLIKSMAKIKTANSFKDMVDFDKQVKM